MTQNGSSKKKIVKCPKCNQTLLIDLKGLTIKDVFVTGLKCPTHGSIELPAKRIALLNWQSGYVNKNAYPTFKSYLNYMIKNCRIFCFDCKFNEFCYKGFFLDPDKEDLIKEN